MQSSSLYIASQRRDFSGFSHNFQSEPGFSRAWASTSRSPLPEQTPRSRTTSDESEKGIAGFFRNCFGLRRDLSNGVIARAITSRVIASPINGSHNISTAANSRVSSANGGTITSDHRNDESQNISWTSQPRFSFEILSRATSNFNEENKIGQGGFGSVYKGRLEDGSLIAIKRANKNMHGMAHLDAEFKREIQTLSKVEHINLVKFLGYLENEDERLIVVEYVNNGTLREHLDGLRGEPLDLGQRLNVAIDIAHALTYLHEYADRPIIHRDIKSENILLTDKLRAKVADFGFARPAPADSEGTHVHTLVKGTPGYIDPEYLHTSELTDRSDVYSFGVLLIELITGRRPIMLGRRSRKERLTIEWAIRNYNRGEVMIAVDPRLRRSRPAAALVEKMMGLAAECTAETRRSRSAMRKCAEVLWAARKEYQQDQQREQAAAEEARARGAPSAREGRIYGVPVSFRRR